MNEIYSVKGKTAIVTGASAGIGRHFALTLAKHGANVICVGRHKERLDAIEKECLAQGVQAMHIATDVSNADAVKNLIDQSKSKFPKVDILINTAGIAMRVPSLEITEKQWDDVLDINLKGTFLLIQSVANWMIESKTAGSIINISSSAAFHTTTTRAAYSASKIAVESLTRTFALELVKHGIRVNCIAPGFFVTDLTREYIKTEIGMKEIAAVPMQRAANVSELVGALLLLSSQASSYMTGSILHIDGGYAVNKT